MPPKTDVIWLSYHSDVLARGYWDQGLLEDLFKRGDYKHREGFVKRLPDGAVVILNGRTHANVVDRINEDLERLRWAVLIITGDEEAEFPFEQIKHPLIRIWVMHPRMNRHNDTSFKLPNGYRTDTHDILKEIGRPEKKYDFMFVGQVNHARREQCLEAANAMPAEFSRYIVATDSFGKEEINQCEYLTRLAESRIVLCPSGIETPDSFRLYEALEAGCLPIVDAFSTKNPDWGFWPYLFGEEPPFPVIPYWSDLPAMLPALLRDYPANANIAFAWWQNFKGRMYQKLIDDITEVSK